MDFSQRKILLDTLWSQRNLKLPSKEKFRVLTPKKEINQVISFIQIIFFFWDIIYFCILEVGSAFLKSKIWFKQKYWKFMTFLVFKTKPMICLKSWTFTIHMVWKYYEISIWPPGGDLFLTSFNSDCYLRYHVLCYYYIQKIAVSLLLNFQAASLV